ncbi:MAG: hypothetical protein E6Q97_30720 [Desulfurellales bacterium]|nr:MAG: hypothetical protein E6Q97_30720 [Desulfurellales bacterium]
MPGAAFVVAQNNTIFMQWLANRYLLAALVPALPMWPVFLILGALHIYRHGWGDVKAMVKRMVITLFLVCVASLSLLVGVCWWLVA